MPTTIGFVKRYHKNQEAMKLIEPQWQQEFDNRVKELIERNKDTLTLDDITTNDEL